MMSLAGRRLLAAACIAGWSVAGACSGDGTTSTVLDEVAPTKADIAREAAIAFPDSTADFRLVRVGPGQIDVSFTIETTDIAAFASGSGIELRSGERTLTHASPLWDVAVSGDVSGGSSERGGVDRSAEVVVDADRATVRLTIEPEAGS